MLYPLSYGGEKTEGTRGRDQPRSARSTSWCTSPSFAHPSASYAAELVGTGWREAYSAGVVALAQADPGGLFLRVVRAPVSVPATASVTETATVRAARLVELAERAGADKPSDFLLACENCARRPTPDGRDVSPLGGTP
jgi:hypothetical protein